MSVEAASRPGPESDEEGLALFGFDDDRWVVLMRDASRPEELGAVAGYRVLDEVSRGGQGVVFRAREESSGRLVALKRLAAGSLAGSEARARFRREIEAEAALRHPHIVGFHGVEVVEGQPLLVMEWVDGRPADRWARGEDGARPVREVLETFARICDAVAYAHQRGVIHRDLKPSNILVDAAGEPHVLDFGLARWRPGVDGGGGGGAEPSRLTVTEGFVGTPAYAAPEQLTPGSDGADVRSDVYALGVVLYEMLAGERPFEADPGDWERLFRSIREQDPPPPSRHDRRINGELDAIVLRAIAKEPARRYQAAHELGADVRRFLAGEAVEARRDSGWYVARKLLRRHRVAVGAGGAVVAALLAGLALAAAGLVAARRGAAEATRHAEVAEAVNEFLNVDVLRAIVPAGERAPATGRDVKLREVLDEAGRRLDAASAPGGRLADKPQVEAGIRATLANSYLELGEPGAAEPHVVRERALLERLYGLDDPRFLRTALNLSWVFNQQGRYGESVELFRSVLERFERTPGIDPGLNADIEHNLAVSWEKLGRFDEAAPLYARAAEHRAAALGPEHGLTLGSLNGVAEAYRSQRRFAEAEPVFRRLIETAERTLGRTHPQTLMYTGNFGSLLWDQARYDEAEPLMQRVLDGFREVHGPAHPNTLLALSNLANLLDSTGESSRAEALRREAFETLRREFGPEHPDTLRVASDLAGSLMTLERPDEALALFEPTLEAQRRVRGPEHVETRRTLNNLALLYRRLERYAEAERLTAEVIDLARRIDGPEHPRFIGARLNLAILYAVTGRLEEAREVTVETLPVARGALGTRHPYTRNCMRVLGQVLEDLGRPEEARPIWEELKALEAGGG